jgi:hypothetical protein
LDPGLLGVKRLTILTTICGGVMIAIGLVVVGSTAGKPNEQETRMAGMLAMSFGGMLVAIPMYIAARRLESERKTTNLRKGRMRGASRCATCGQETASFWCTTHTVRLCGDCVPKHDQPGRCLYKSLVSAPAPARR